MKITLITVGKIKEKYFTDAIAEYSKRLSRYCKLEIVEVPDEKTPDGASEALENQIKEKEELLEKYENTSSYLIDRIKICNAYIEQVKGYEIPKEITADTLLENVEYIYVYKLPNTTSRTQTKTNHVELDVSTRLKSQLEYLSFQFEGSMDEYPSLALDVIADMDEETKESLLGSSPI